MMKQREIAAEKEDEKKVLSPMMNSGAIRKKPI